MEEPFDKLLSEHIRNTFDNYEDDTADFGWNQLLLKQQSAKRKMVIPLWVWLSVPTAAILTFFVLNLNYLQEKKSDSVVLVSMENPSVQNQTLKAAPKQNLNKSSKIIEKSPIEYQIQLSNEAFASINELVESSVINIASLNVNKIPQNNIEQPVIRQVLLSSVLPKRQIINLKQRDIKEYVAVSKPKTDNNLDFSLMAGSFMSYADGTSNNSFGYNAGFDIDIPIVSNLQINTGLNLGRQSLEFNNNNQLPAVADARMMNQMVSNDLIAITPESYKTSMVAIDLPISIKAVFPIRKSSLFVTGGLSSYTYLNQTYSSSYYSYSSSSNNRTIEYLHEEDRGLFSQIDWFRTMNVSVGIDYKLGKNSLTVEPYYKYPLGGLGADQIRWNSAGFNLKFSFSK